MSSVPGALPCPREAKHCGGRSGRLRPHGSRGRSAPGKTRRCQSRTPYCRIRSSRPAPRSSLRALGPARVSSDFIPPTARACWGAPGWGAPSPAMPTNVNIASSRQEFRAWLEARHASEDECWLRVRRGRPGAGAGELGRAGAGADVMKATLDAMFNGNVLKRLRSRSRRWGRWLGHRGRSRAARGGACGLRAAWRRRPRRRGRAP